MEAMEERYYGIRQRVSAEVVGPDIAGTDVENALRGAEGKIGN